jgi:pyruvate dehydrogenase E2 component (dihydrolipoamide acetyltransferase)
MVEDEGSVEAFKEFTIDDAGGAKAPPKPSAEEEKPAEKEEPKESKEPKEEQKDSAPKKESKDETPAPDFGGPIAASPIARRLALERGVPLKSIKGTGPGGRIIKADIEKYTPASTTSAPATAAPGAQPSDQGYTDIPLTGMRKAIAKRLSESMFTKPHYYLTSSINMTKTLKLRKALNDAAIIKDGKPAYRLSVNDFIVKAVSCALLRVPEANSQWLDKEGVLRLFSYVDISVFPYGSLI